MSPRPFPYGPDDRRAGARHPGGLLRTLSVLDYEILQLPEWDVLAPGPGISPSLDPESDAPPASD